jgi:AAA+ superfamily predicted ATPase
MLDGTLCTDGTVFVITTNHKDHLDPALFRAGRINVEIEFQKCDEFQYSSIYEKIIEKPIPRDLLLRLPVDKFTPAEFIFELIQYAFDKKPDETMLARFLI